MSNIRTVSKLAGVSVATVSRTFSTPESVSEKTRKKVEAAAKDLGYRPNLLARNFRAKRSYAIMVLVPNIANPFFSRVISGIEASAQAKGYSVLLGNTGGRREREIDYASMVHSFQADGIIQLSASYPFDIAASEIRPPLVNICECYDQPVSPQIQLDNKGAAAAMVEHLVDLGHKQIGIMIGPSSSPLTHDRLAGCRQVFDRHGITVDDRAIAEGDFSSQSGFEAIDKLLSLRKRPTAIFCFNDEMAIGAIRRIRELGFSVPGDISVAGFDDIDFASYCAPALTTIKQPAELFGTRAVDLLCEIIEMPAPAIAHERLTLPYELIIRGSTAPPRNT
ncbi:MAG: LacI family DNA-binding transcriptional regulator [Hyphomonadaceae bacterium]